MFFKFLSKDYPIEKSNFVISRWCLGSMGQFPQRTSSTLRNINSAFHIAILFAGVLAQYWYGMHYIKVDLQIGLDAVCPAISCNVSFIKMLLINWYGKDLAMVTKHVRELLFAEKDEKYKIIARDLSSKANSLVFMVLALGVIAYIFYGFRPLLNNAFRAAMGLDYNYEDLPLRVMAPAVMLTLPWYPLTYALTCYMAHVTVIAFSGVDGIFICFCLYASALLKVLQNDIKKTLAQFGCDRKLSADENQICCEQLARIVVRHNEIIDMVQRFASLFMWIVLIHFVTSALVIGASIIEALLFPGFRAIVYTTYTMAVSCELFIYCYGGSAILENSNGLGRAAYFSNWTHCDTKVQRMILMIIIRSQRPLTMAVPFFTPSLATFTSIVRTAGSIATLVQSVVL